MSAVVGINKPTEVFGSTDRTPFELQVLANKAAKMIAEAYEWQALQVLATITGDNSTTDWAFESDFGRMLLDTQLWHSTSKCPMPQVDGANEWQRLVTQGNLTFAVPGWIIKGGRIYTTSALSGTTTATYWYMSNKIVVDSLSTTKATFTADTDSFRLDETLLELAMIWRWKSQKGQAYAEEMADYEKKLDELIMKDKGPKILTMSGRPQYRGTPAYPWALGQ